MEFRQIKTGLGITLITNETINSIAKVRVFEGKDAKELNEYLYELNKKVLSLAKNKNRSWEVGALWNTVTNKVYWFRGNDTGISVKSNKNGEIELYNGSGKTLIWTHNHPRNRGFSSADMNSFIFRESILAMIAVCNDGRIHTLFKMTNFNEDKCTYYYNMAKPGEKFRNVVKHQNEIGVWYRCSVPNKRRTI